MSDTCRDLKVIPQYDARTCWFNSILMALLYSENARKMLISNSKTWDKSNKFLNILKYILKNYDKPSIEDYYKHMQPQIILFQFFKSFKLNDLKNFFKENIRKDINDFSLDPSFITIFLSKINPKTLDITYDSEKDTKIIGIQEYFTYKYERDFLGHSLDKVYDYNKNYLQGIIKKIIENIPDFIILYHSDLGNIIPIELYNIFKLNDLYKSKVFDLSTYNITEDGIKEYKDIITFNNVKYKLDSCIISNFNDPQHAIVGITCNSNRYVYNGWLSVTSPCPLIKYDWGLRKDEEFCLNTKKCKLDNKDERNLCFSFAQGERILVYVRIPPDQLLSSDKFELSNPNEFLKDMYSIDELTKDELKEHLLYFILPKYKGNTKDDLRSFLDNEFKKININELRYMLLSNILNMYHNPKKDKPVDLYMTEEYINKFVSKQISSRIL
jgi:hypothetical protein